MEIRTRVGAALRWVCLPQGILAIIVVLAMCHALAFSIVVDDSFISFRYAENLAAGLGLTFNEGEYVEGYTNFLWVLVLAACDCLGLSTLKTSVPLGIACYLATIIVVYRASCRLGLPRYSALVAPLVLACSVGAARWSSSGMETALFGLLITMAVLRFITEEREDSRAPISGVLFGLACMTRPEAAAVLALSMLASAGKLRQRFRWLAITSVVFAGIVIPHTLFRLYYYGYPLPNTFYAKVDVDAKSWKAGFDYFFGFAVPALLPTTVFLAGLAKLHKAHICPMAVLATSLAGTTVYILSVGGDFYDH